MVHRRERVFRDPVHGNVRIEEPVVLDLIDSAEFQRLRRIRQLGMCFNTYYGAEHSRFQHSIGAMWIMVRILNTWRDRRLVSLSRGERQAAMVAALLHDVGHGPFSHALETVFARWHHEEIGRQIIERRLAPVLQSHGVDVPLVLGIIDGSGSHRYLNELISSQLDVDRMDYLQRDSLYAGVRYGLFDLERVIATLVPVPAGDSYLVAIDAKGQHAAEEYIFCRYFMYWQVYFHKTTRAAEVLLRLVLERARELADGGDAIYLPPNLRFVFEARRDDELLDSYLDIDDYDVFAAIKQWQRATDPVLSYLARSFMGRHLFKSIPCPEDADLHARVWSRMTERYGDNARYYCHFDRPSDSAYDFYRAGAGKPTIQVLVAPGETREISQAAMTGAIRALAHEVSRSYVVVCEESKAEVEQVLASAAPQQTLLPLLER
ncbi:MAG: HD domain-containing protein [Candidatus Xenobia bacterium]